MKFIPTSHSGTWINPDHIKSITLNTISEVVRVVFHMTHGEFYGPQDFETEDEARAWLMDDLDIELG